MPIDGFMPRLIENPEWPENAIRRFRHGSSTIYVCEIAPVWYTGHYVEDERGEFMQPVYVGGDKERAIEAFEQQCRAFIFICRLTDEEIAATGPWDVSILYPERQPEEPG